MIIELIIISIFAGFVTHKRSKFTRIFGSGVITYIALLVYYIFGFYYNNSYEPEMLLGWLMISTVGNILVIPISFLLGKVLLTYKQKTT